MARPSKLTPEREAAICDALAEGASWRAAAAAAGVDESTVHRWRAAGEARRSGKFREFRERATRARALGELAATRRVYAAFTGPHVERRTETLPDGGVRVVVTERPPDALMALKFLERRCPAEWSPRHLGDSETQELPSVIEIAFKRPEKIAAEEDESAPVSGGAMPVVPQRQGESR